MAQAPELLTVLEAARVLRVGKSLIYEAAAEYRATGGKSGLPVVEVLGVLRVPRVQLEEMLGVSITSVPPSDATTHSRELVVAAPR